MTASAEQTVAAIKDAERYVDDRVGALAPWWATKRGGLVPASRLFDHELNPVCSARVGVAHEAIRSRIANETVLFIYPLADAQGGAAIGWEDHSGAIYVAFASDLRVKDERLPVYVMLDAHDPHGQTMSYPGDIVVRGDRTHLRLSNLLLDGPAATPGAELAQRLRQGTNSVGSCDFGGENRELTLRGDKRNVVPCGTDTLAMPVHFGMFVIVMEICEMCYSAAVNVVAEGMETAILAAHADAAARFGSFGIVLNPNGSMGDES